MQHDGDDRHEHAHENIGFGYLVDDVQRHPLECADGHHNHHAHQGRHGDAFDHGRAHQDEEQNCHRSYYASQPCARARIEVHQPLRHHGASAHAAEEAVHHIGSALCQGFAVGTATCTGDLVYHR